MSEEHGRVLVRITGRVQGVGMRWWIRARALELGLVGAATNRSDGSVEVLAQGTPTACQALVALLAPEEAPPGRPGTVSTRTVRAMPTLEPPPEGFVER